MAGLMSLPTSPSPHISQPRPKSSTIVMGRNPLPLQTFLICSKFPVTKFTFSSSIKSICQKKPRPLSIPKASVGSTDHVVEPETNVKFQKDLKVPGGSESLILLGTGYREKVFAIIGVKVYAAGFYADVSITERLTSWKGRSSADILVDSSLFSSVFEAPTEKSLKLILVRDIDGKTFWNALDDVISPRINEPTNADDSALSLFRKTFEKRPLKKGTSIFLTWVEPSKMLVSISSDGFPSKIDAVIESMNVTSALFDAFLGGTPVSPTLKASIANGLAIVLK